MLARVVRGERSEPSDDPSVAELAAGGLISGEGCVANAVLAVAVAAASTLVRLDIARVGVGRTRGVQVWWSPVGLLMGPAGPADLVDDVAFCHPSALARTLWRLLQLGPRPQPDGALGPLSAENLLAPFDGSGGSQRGWLRSVTAQPGLATLDRIDLRMAPDNAPVTLVLVDTPEGLWEITSQDGAAFHVRASSSTAIFSTFAAWQRSLERIIGANVPVPAALRVR